ncbi:MAG: hypothetical protein FGM56_05995, partial [Limnohabitans sp.]|nr:hypothetical protein [Limnohabitans sp.]
APASGANTYAVAATSNNVYESAGTAAFTITRSGDLTIANTSYFRANSGTASNVTDYTAVTSNTLNWAVGETTKVVSVVLQNDALAEVSKTIIGESATNAGFTTSVTSGTLTILDDDTPGSGTNTYTIAQTTTSNIESNGTLAFTITRGGDQTIGSTSYFRTNSGTAATDGSDYTVVNSQTLTWVASETTKVVFVTLTNDTISEANETVIGQSASDAAFTPGATTVSVTATVLDDDLWTATAGVADTITYGTASGSYTGAINVDTGDLADTVSITSNVGFSGFGSIVLGSGNDLLNVNSQTNFLNVVSADGGSGVDTLAYSGTTAFNHHTQTVDSNVIGFEILDLATAATNQTVGLSLADVLEITRGNALADTLRIMGNAVSGDVLNLQAAGKTLATPVAGSTIKDVDGTNYTVSASAAGNALANDVTIGGKTYDVYQYAFDSHTINLLVHTTITTNVI